MVARGVVTYDQLTGGGPFGVCPVPKGAVITHVVLVPTSAFMGPGIDSFLVSLGSLDEPQKYAGPYQICCEPGPEECAVYARPGMESLTQARVLYLTATSSGTAPGGAPGLPGPPEEGRLLVFVHYFTTL